MKETESRNEIGIKALIRKGRKQFRIQENLQYYAPDSLKIAEKQFIKECILNGKCE
jgi:plastocyanin domain-containing protein